MNINTSYSDDSVHTGDANIHSTLWHSFTNDQKGGQIIADVISNSDNITTITATRMPNQNTPTRMPNENTSTRMPNQNTSTRMPNKNTSTRMPNQNTSTRMPNQNTSTRMPNQLTPP